MILQFVIINISFTILLKSIILHQWLRGSIRGSTKKRGKITDDSIAHRIERKGLARKATNKKQKSLEEILWDSANKLRGSVEPSEYNAVLLSLKCPRPGTNDSCIGRVG